MHAYYTVNDPESPMAVFETAQRKARYEQWTRVLPGEDDDTEIVAHRFASDAGVTPRMALRTLFALRRLLMLPLLREVQEDWYHLDFQRLIAIDHALNKADMEDKETAAYLDAHVAAFLTPKRPRQQLPTAKAIANKIDELITSRDSSVAGNSEMPEEPIAEYKHAVQSKAASAVGVLLDRATAAVVDEHIRATAKEQGITPVEAFIKLTTGALTPAARVTLNVFAASTTAEIGFLPGTGWVRIEDLGEVTKTHDLNRASTRTAAAYSTPEDIAQYVEGRDGTCRFPGCTRPAEDCQKDHRINHADGGPTSADNLVSLCQHHHNIKTDGRVFYLLDSVTATVYWLLGDGTWTTTEPSGPLAPDKVHWLQTFGQAAASRAAAVREAAQQAKAAHRAQAEAEFSFADASEERGFVTV